MRLLPRSRTVDRAVWVALVAVTLALVAARVAWLWTPATVHVAEAWGTSTDPAAVIVDPNVAVDPNAYWAT